jgi:uncharacterized protein (DUF58 family)
MPTRSGWLVLAAGIATIVAGRIFAISELFVLGVGLVLLVALTTARTMGRTLRVAVRRVTEPARPVAGGNARVELIVHAASSTPAIDLWEPVGDAGGASIRLAPLRRGERAGAAYRLPTHQRGLVTVGPLRADVHDVLGLSRRTTELAAARTVLVYPQWQRVPLPSLNGGSGPLSRHLASRALGHPAATEFKSLRDYAVGDDLRMVHWKASARRVDGLVIRETDSLADLHLTVVLDLWSEGYSDEGFERAVSATASLALSAADEGRVLRLLTTDHDEFIVDALSAEATMEFLATVRRSHGMHQSPTRSWGDGLHVAILVTGNPGTGRLPALRTVAGRSDGLVVVACDGPSSRGPGAFFVDASTDMAFGPAFTALVGATTGHARLAPRVRSAAAMAARR